MHSFRLAASLLAAVVLAGCANYRPYRTYESAGTRTGVSTPPSRNHVDVKDDQFDGFIKFYGIDERHDADMFGVRINVYYLYSAIDKKKGTLYHFITVNDSYISNDFKDYYSAYDEDGQELNFLHQNKHWGHCGHYTGCSKDETFTAFVSENTLKSKAETGYRVKFYSKAGGEKIIALSSGQIKAQLAAVAERMPKPEPPKAPPPAANKKPAAAKTQPKRG